jgi:orotidine-5'-phosphate decarboxylase
MTTSSFGATLAALKGPARLCVGVDPHPSTLAEWGLGGVEGLRSFSRSMLDAMVESGVAITKPQVALFERFGVDGMRTLAQFIAEARSHSLLVIADVKRGDIGTSLAGYASAWLSPGSDFESDAMTAVAYQGVGSLEPAFHLAAEAGKGVFVLGATSNPEGWGIQSARTTEGDTVAHSVIAGVAERSLRAPRSEGNWLGVVVGATVDREHLGLAESTFQGMSILAPGFGAQGVELSSVHDVFGPLTSSVIPTVSRSVAGSSADGLLARIRQHQSEIRDG